MTVKPQTFGERLRSERVRLGLNQTDFAALAGIKRTAQHFYETDARVPDIRYLERIQQAGADIKYLMGAGSVSVRAVGSTTTAQAAGSEPAAVAHKSGPVTPRAPKAPRSASHQAAVPGDALQQLVQGYQSGVAEATKLHEFQSEAVGAVLESLRSGERLIVTVPEAGKKYRLVESLGQEAVRKYGPSVRVLVVLPTSASLKSPEASPSSTKKAATPKKSAVKRSTPA